MASNAGTLTSNAGTVTTNESTGIVTNTADGTVDTNKGTVNNEAGGVIKINAVGGHVDFNSKTMDSNAGELGENKAGGTVTINTGAVTTNAGTVTTNDGDINTNSGTVNANNHDITNNTGTVNNNNANAEIGNNDGTVNTNAGTVNDNNSIIKDNTSIVVTNDGTIEINTGYVGGNNSVIRTNNGSGVVGTNEGQVLNNTATVTTNTEAGLVENLAGGIVDTNNGTVYNYGGRVNNNIGTEYFSVSIADGSNSTHSGGTFASYKDASWLGTTGETQSSTTIVVTPTNGYKIYSFDIPDEYKGFVTATKNEDGSWNLTVKSGLNISLSLPDATRASASGGSTRSSSGSGSGGSGGKGVTSTVLNQTINPVNDLTVVAVATTGTTLAAPVSNVVTGIDIATAFNNFAASNVQTYGSENIVGTGAVDFHHVFDTAASTAVDVPITANVKAGNTYRVLFSDTSSIDVLCTYDGILYIPVSKVAEGLTYIVYGTATDPAAAMMAAQQMTGTVVTNPAANLGIFDPATLALAGLAS